MAIWMKSRADSASIRGESLSWSRNKAVANSTLSKPNKNRTAEVVGGSESVLFATALFLDQDKDSPRIDAESALDFIQIAIVFFFIYLEYYYLPARRLGNYSAFLRGMRVENLEDASLTLLAAYQALRARNHRTRKLYGGLDAH